MLLGLTGGYCAGKNAVAALLEKNGWTCIDVDRLGHEALSLAGPAVAARFGPSLLAPDGSIDRRALGRIVFADPEALSALESITHPIMFRLVDEAIAAAGGGTAVASAGVCVNAALLYMMPQVSSCDAIIEVRAPFLVRIIRGVARDDLSLVEAAKRILRQRRLWSKRRRSGVPIVLLQNRGGYEDLVPSLARALAIAVRRSEARTLKQG